MSNLGRTTIKATGSPQDLAALAVHIRGTARDGSAFTLSGLMRPDPAPDHAVRRTELSATNAMVALSISITRNRDALSVAARIAKRFPALRIVGHFAAGRDEAAFDAVCFARGKLAYRAHFDHDMRFPVSANGLDGRSASWVRCFKRAPARSAAAPDHMDAADLAWLADRPAVAGGWRDATADSLGGSVYSRPSTTDGTGLALVAGDGTFVLLTGMDRHGGYGRRKHLHAEDVVSHLPALAAEVGRHLRDHAADWMAPKPSQACRSDPDDFGIPF